MSYISDLDIFKALSESSEPLEFNALCEILGISNNSNIRHHFTKRLNQLVNKGFISQSGAIIDKKYVYYFALSSGAANALDAQRFVLDRVDVADRSSRRAFIVSLVSLGVSIIGVIISLIAFLR